MSINLHYATGVGLFALAGAVLAVLVWWRLSARHDRAGDEQLYRAATALISAAPLPPYDGETWDWPEGGLRDYFFGGDAQPYYDAYGQDEPPLPFPVRRTEPGLPYPAPQLPTSQDQPGQLLAEPFPDDDADRYIDEMRARTDALITAMSQPQPAWA